MSRPVRNRPGRGPSRGKAALAWLLTSLLICLPHAALAQAAKEPPPRNVHFEWDESRRLLYVGVSFRDAIDDHIRRKLRRGLPTTIVMTAAVYRPGVNEPISTTAQTCKITWHVWKEVYLVELTRPGGHRVEKTLNALVLEG